MADGLRELDRRGPPGRRSFCPEPPSLEDHCKARRYAPVVEHATTTKLLTIKHVFAVQFRGGAQLTDGSQRGPNFHHTWRGHRTMTATQVVCFRVWISCRILNASGSKLSDVENDAKFRTY